MKGGLEYIMGKTISDVVVSKSNQYPNNQVFLVFTDDTYLEIFGQEFTCAGHIDKGNLDSAIRYARKNTAAKIEKIYRSNEFRKRDSLATDKPKEPNEMEGESTSATPPPTKIIWSPSSVIDGAQRAALSVKVKADEPMPMTYKRYMDLMEFKLSELIHQETPGEALQLVEEFLPELRGYLDGTDNLPAQIMVSDWMMSLLNKIDWDEEKKAPLSQTSEMIISQDDFEDESLWSLLETPIRRP